MNRNAMTAYAAKQVGRPYRMGGPGSSFDCSELTQKSLAAGGVKVPRTSQGQAHWFRGRGALVGNSKANRALLLPGDLMFWYGSLRDPNSITHVGIYVGRSLGRYMVVAAVDERHGVMKHRSDWALKPIGFGLLGCATR